MALKSNKITWAVAESVEKIAENYVWTREIIPIWDKKVWFMAAQKWIQDTIETITKTDSSKQYDNIVKPETERFADTFAGKKSEMNSWVYTNLAKDKKDAETKWEEFNDAWAITKAVDAVSKNTSYSLSDIDTNKWFNWNQELIDALSTKSNKDWYYHADSWSKKYSEIKGILDGKKVWIASQDWKKYSDAMWSFYQSNKTNTIAANNWKILITKNRLWKDGIIKFTVDNTDKLTEVEHIPADILSYKNKDITTAKELDDFIGKFNNLWIEQPAQYWNDFAPKNITNSLTTWWDIDLLDEKKNAVTYNLKLNEAKVIATKK